MWKCLISFQKKPTSWNSCENHIHSWLSNIVFFMLKASYLLILHRVHPFCKLTKIGFLTRFEMSAKSTFAPLINQRQNWGIRFYENLYEIFCRRILDTKILHKSSKASKRDTLMCKFQTLIYFLVPPYHFKI